MVAKSLYKLRCAKVLGTAMLILLSIGVSETRLLASTDSSKSSSSAITFVPEQIRFMDVPADETYTQTVRLTNFGEATLQIQKITASSPDFQVIGVLLPVVVAHGTSESFTVAYHGIAERQSEGEIRIFTDSSDAPFVLKVKASTGTAQADLTASAANIEFEDVAVGSSSRKELSLRNAGNREVRIAGISVSGADFSLSGVGAVNLGPGQEISLGVSFAPKSAARRTGSLRILGAEGELLLEIPVVAAGAAPAQNNVKLKWEESPAAATGYAIYRAAEASGPYTRISSVTSAEFVDTEVAAGHTYYYVVTMVNPDETESEYSEPISATVPSV
jgi:hypothetical protein